jgi:hydrogenase maturation protease
MTGTLVLGLGNTLLGDDGIGVRVIERLQGEDIGAEIMNGATLGLSLLETLKSRPKIVVVDAVDMGKAPGSVVRFSVRELLTMAESRSFSLHEIGLFEVLKIGQSLNEDFGNVIIFGVQPKELHAIEQLSPEVEGKITEVVEMIKKEVV